MEAPGVWEGEKNADLIRSKFDELYSKHFQDQHTVLAFPPPTETILLPNPASTASELNQTQPASSYQISPHPIHFNRPGEDPRAQAQGIEEPCCHPGSQNGAVGGKVEELPVRSHGEQGDRAGEAAVQLAIECKETPVAQTGGLINAGVVSGGGVRENQGGSHRRTRSSRRQCKCCAGGVTGRTTVKGEPANGVTRRLGPLRRGAVTGKASLESGSDGQWAHDVPGGFGQVLVWPSRAGLLGKQEQKVAVRCRKSEKLDWMLGRRVARRGSGLGDRVKAAGVGAESGLGNQVNQRDLVESDPSKLPQAQKEAAVFLQRNLRFGRRSRESSEQTGRLSKPRVVGLSKPKAMGSLDLVESPTEEAVSGAEPSRKRARGSLTSATASGNRPPIEPSSTTIRSSKRARIATRKSVEADPSVPSRGVEGKRLKSAPPIPVVSGPLLVVPVSTGNTNSQHQRRPLSLTTHPAKPVKIETPPKPSSKTSPAAVLVTRSPSKRISRRGTSSQQGGDKPLVSSPPEESEVKSVAVKRTRKEMDLAGAAGRPICRVCRAEYDERRCYLACDVCDRWYHADAFGYTPETAVALTKFKCPHCRHTTRPARCSVRNPSDPLASPLNVQPKLRQKHVFAYADGSGPQLEAQMAGLQNRSGERRPSHRVSLTQARGKGGMWASATSVKRAFEGVRNRKGGRYQGAKEPLEARKSAGKALKTLDRVEQLSTLGGATGNGSRSHLGARAEERGRELQSIMGGQESREDGGEEPIVAPVNKRPPLRLVGVTHPANLRLKELAGGARGSGSGNELGVTPGEPLPAGSLGAEDRGFDAKKTFIAALGTPSELETTRLVGAVAGGSGFGVCIDAQLESRVDVAEIAQSRSIQGASTWTAQIDGDTAGPLGDAPVGAPSLAALKAHRPIGRMSDRTAQHNETVSKPLADAIASKVAFTGAPLGLVEKAELSKRSEPATPTPPRKRIQPTRLDPVPQPVNAEPPGLTAGTGSTASRPEGPVSVIVADTNQGAELRKSAVENLRGPVESGAVSQSGNHRPSFGGPVIERVGRYSWEAGYYQAADRASGGGPVLPDRIHTGAASGQSARWSIDLSKVQEVDGRRVKMAAGTIDGVEQLA